MRFEFRGKEDSGSKICEPWLHVEPTHGELITGDSLSIRFKVLIDVHQAWWMHRKQKVSNSKVALDILVLHVENGRDIFITVLGEYRPSCFGFSVETLSRLPQPVYELDLKDILQIVSVSLSSTSQWISRDLIWLDSVSRKKIWINGISLQPPHTKCWIFHGKYTYWLITWIAMVWRPLICLHLNESIPIIRASIPYVTGWICGHRRISVSQTHWKQLVALSAESDFNAFLFDTNSWDAVYGRRSLINAHRIVTKTAGHPSGGRLPVRRIVWQMLRDNSYPARANEECIFIYMHVPPRIAQVQSIQSLGRRQVRWAL